VASTVVRMWTLGFCGRRRVVITILAFGAWVLTGLSAAAGDVASPAVEKALEAWEKSDRHVGVEQLSAWSEAIRGETPRGDAEVLARLLALAGDDSRVRLSPHAALRLACELADDVGTRQILDFLRPHLETAAKGFRGVPPSEADKVRVAKGFLRTFVMYGAEALMSTTENQEPVTEFLTAVCIRGGQEPKLDSVCARLIAECELPLARRQEAALEIVEKKWKRGAPEEVLLELLGLFDETTLPRLRHLVRDGDAWDTFHYGAADVLSYLADKEIVADLEAWRPVLRAEHVNLEEYVRRCIWRIEVQSPATKLLDYIEGVEHAPYYESRFWAVRRADALGVPHERIREAILEHARRCRKEGTSSPLVELKWTGLQLGILKDDDMPEVQIPPTTVTE